MTETTHAGVLLVNLGTPDAPTPQALRRYLAEFLWDPRVVDLPRPLWWLILNGIILNIRPRRSARLYEKIWTDEGSPLLAIGKRQRAKLEQALGRKLAATMPVVLAMRYGQPSVRSGLETVRAQGCGRVLVLPLYPQYSDTTTASTSDAVAAALKEWPDPPELRFVRHYHTHQAYIRALAQSVRDVWEAEGEPEKLLMSFHGIPQRYANAGDPYPRECAETARLLAGELGLGKERWLLSFQSRFGREPWLTPYTDETLRAWGGQGIKRVDVICPGFAADCLETLEEIAMQNRDIFLGAGGERFRYIPALNDRDDHIAALAAIIQANLAGWL